MTRSIIAIDIDHKDSPMSRLVTFSVGAHSQQLLRYCPLTSFSSSAVAPQTVVAAPCC